MGFLHIQRQLQLAFQKGTAFLADGLGMGLRPFDNDDEVIGITTIGYGRFPLAVLSNRDRTTLLNAEVPLRKNCLTGVNSTLLLPLSPPPPPSPRPTLEVTIVETASTLRRKKRADLGIALIDI